MSRLPSRFFGSKVFLKHHYDQLVSSRFSEGIKREVLLSVFEWGPEEKKSEYYNYLKMALDFAQKESYSFEKVSCLVEMASHVLEKSME